MRLHIFDNALQHAIVDDVSVAFDFCVALGAVVLDDFFIVDDAVVLRDKGDCERVTVV